MNISDKHAFSVTESWLATVPSCRRWPIRPRRWRSGWCCCCTTASTGRRTTGWPPAAVTTGTTCLPTRIRLATYNSINLHQWWTASAARLGSSPRTDEQRAELATLLTMEARPVLQVMRDQTTALTLRTRIVADAVRASRTGDARGLAS